MENMTVINYSFFYKNGEPWFYSFSVGIYNGSTTVFHEAGAPIDDSYAFQNAHDKVLLEGFELTYQRTCEEDNTRSEHYDKIIKG